MSAVGRRYAEALMDLCGPGNALAVAGDLAAFGAWLGELPDLRRALENPSVTASAKHALLADLAARGGLRPETARFLDLVVAHRRLRQWGEIEGAFRDLSDEARGVARAKVVTAQPLGGARQEAFAARLRKALGREVVMEEAQDPSLLGGVVLTVGSTVYDGSAAGALRSLRAALEKR